MKISRHLLLFACCILMLLCKSFAQKASIYNYVITNKGDTIHCELIKGLFGKVRYQPVTATDGKYIKVTPKEIKTYYFAKDSSTYAAVALPGNTDAEYLKWVEQGKINLYEKVTTSTSGYVTSYNYFWYVSKDGSPLKELKSNTMFNDGGRKVRKGIFMDMIADDAPLLDKFNAEDKFSFEQLQTYVHQYNADKTGAALTSK